jgi:group I intron endonuclease
MTMAERKSGIYKIVNILDGKIYIGSSSNFCKRWNGHITCLRKNKHHSPHLQNAWNKYGEENFKFEIVEVVEDFNKLFEREQYYIDLYKCFGHDGYNAAKIVTEFDQYKFKQAKNLSEEQKQEIRNIFREGILTQDQIAEKYNTTRSIIRWVLYKDKEGYKLPERVKLVSDETKEEIIKDFEENCLVVGDLSKKYDIKNSSIKKFLHKHYEFEPVFTVKFMLEIREQFKSGQTIKELSDKLQLEEYQIKKLLKNNRQFKLTLKELNDIIEEYKKGEITYPELAKKYNVSVTKIGDIIREDNKAMTLSEETKKRMSEEQRGEKSAMAKLNWDIVKDIRRMFFVEKRGYKEISEKYNVSSPQIYNILYNRQWVDAEHEIFLFNHAAKMRTFTEEQELQIKQKFLNGENISSISKQFGCSFKRIKRVVGKQ